MSTILSPQSESADEPLSAKPTVQSLKKTRWRKRGKSDAQSIQSAWETAPSINGGLDPMARRVMRWAGGKQFDVEPTQWCSYLRDFLDQFESPHRATVAESITTVLLAATVGHWRTACDAELLKTLVTHWRQCVVFGQQDSADASTVRILLGVELPIVLYGVGVTNKSDVNAAAKFLQSMTQCEGFETCLLQQSCQLRPALASIHRSQMMAKANGKKFADDVFDSMFSLAGWTLALTRQDGGRIHFASQDEIGRDQTSGDDGSENASNNEDLKSDIAWLKSMTKIDAETFKPALDAVRGRRGGEGKLAWEVSLPESFWVDGDAGLAVMIPSWDKRRGRINLDFSGATMRIELLAGKCMIFDGPLETATVIDGKSLKAEGGWEVLCDYTDDDVHYLELEQVLSDGVRVQRQFMQLREDDAVLIGDSVLVPQTTDDQTDQDGPAIIQHTVGLPIAGGYAAQSPTETREVFLHRRKKNHAMVIPISAGEWRMGPTMSTLTADEDSASLRWQSFGGQRLYSPLWIDLQRRRFKRPRTWRRLTVAQELSIVADNVASAFRMQSGSSQWMFYRSLVAGGLRTVLGKHMIHDFFASRFDAGDGVHEELVTVEDE